MNYELKEEKEIKNFTGEGDEQELPLTQNILPWTFFNTDFYSSQSKYESVKEICEEFKDELIDLRPYMIEEPFTVKVSDKLPKVLEIFRNFHLRALPVIDPNNGLPVAVLTR